jgi:hypothetical protein
MPPKRAPKVIIPLSRLGFQVSDGTNHITTTNALTNTCVSSTNKLNEHSQSSLPIYANDSIHKLIDIGANLTSHNFKNIDVVLERSVSANIDTIIITGTDLNSSRKAVNIVKEKAHLLESRKSPRLYTTSGCHPHNASKIIKVKKRLCEHH